MDWELSTIQSLSVQDLFLNKPPVSDRYPESIYYRLLAQNYLPKDLDKVLYLDADILCINDLQPLYELPLEDHLYAAANHSKINRGYDSHQ